MTDSWQTLQERHRRRRIEVGLDHPTPDPSRGEFALATDRPPPHVIPPTDSPLEHRMAELLIKMLDPPTSLVPQYEIATRFGRLRLDFLLGGEGGPRLAIECDGARFHTGFRNAWRDAAILGAGAVDHIVRVRGADLFRERWDVALVLAARFPTLFTARGRASAERLATPEAHEGVTRDRPHVSVWYAPASGRDIDEDAVEKPRGFTHWSLIRIAGRVPPSDDEWRRRYKRLLRRPTLGIDGWAQREAAAWARLYGK